MSPKPISMSPCVPPRPRLASQTTPKDTMRSAALSASGGPVTSSWSPPAAMSDRWALSAGTEPAERVHPVGGEVMREVEIDLADVRPQKLTAELARQADLLITMGCGDACLNVLGLRRDDWPLADPNTRASRCDHRACRATCSECL